MPIINYAHRGASEYYPENTLRSFYAGLEMRADGIETDIQRTKDGVLVLYHDDTLDRVPHANGAIKDYTYEELLKMDFGVFKGERFAGERIVKLDTFLTHFSKRGLTLALEIKQYGVEAESLAAVKAYECCDDVIFTSFLWDSIEKLRKLDNNIRIGYLTNEINAELLEKLQELHIQQVCPKLEMVTEETMKLAQEYGFSVRFWGIRNTDDMKRAIALGGDGMTINFPDKLTEALGK